MVKLNLLLLKDAKTLISAEPFQHAGQPQRSIHRRFLRFRFAVEDYRPKSFELIGERRKYVQVSNERGVFSNRSAGLHVHLQLRKPPIRYRQPKGFMLLISVFNYKSLQ